MKNLFILSTISVNKKSEEEVKMDWAIRNITSKKDIPFEQYLSFIESWNDQWGLKDYRYSEEDNAYFESLDTAKEYARKNISDLNDGGVYNYIAITEVPLNTTYAFTGPQSLALFRYLPENQQYEEVPFNFNEETKLIVKRKNAKFLLESEDK